MGHMMGGFAGAGLMLLFWLIGLGVMFLVVYGAAYLGAKRALRETGERGMPQQPMAPPQSPPPDQQQ